MSKWQNYDYRAVTAGLVFAVMGAIVFSATPSVSLECSRQQQTCTITSKTLTTSSPHTLALASVQKPRKECDRSQKKPTCSVQLAVKGDTGEVFTGIEDEDEAERYARAIRDFLEGRGPDVLRLSRDPDRSWAYGLALLGVVLIVLGIRKNMADKGLIED
jgi:hypothetical protein